MVGVHHQPHIGPDRLPNGLYVLEIPLDAQPYLHLKGCEALLDVTPRLLREALGEIRLMAEIHASGVNPHPVPPSSAQQHRDRLPQDLTLQIPQGEIYGAERGQQHPSPCVVQRSPIHLLP